jgi:hypothetical protein
VEVWSYWDQGHSVYFEKEPKEVCTNFETDNEEAELFGEKVFKLDEPRIIDLMVSQGLRTLRSRKMNRVKRSFFSTMPTCSSFLKRTAWCLSAGRLAWTMMRTFSGHRFCLPLTGFPEISPAFHE